MHDSDWYVPDAILLKIGVLANVHDDPFHVAGYASTLPLTVSSHNATQLVEASTQLRPAKVNDELTYALPTWAPPVISVIASVNPTMQVLELHCNAVTPAVLLFAGSGMGTTSVLVHAPLT